MKPEWEILPRIGLGPVRFGMTRDEAVAAGAIFGAVTHEHAKHEADELLAILGPSMGEDEARALIAKMAADGVDLRPRRHVGFASGLTMNFVADTLETFDALPGARDLHIEGVPFFGADPVPALLKFQALNGAPPLMDTRSCLFDALHVSTADVAVVTAKGLLRLAKSTTMQHLERMVSWGVVSPVGRDLLPRYTRISLEPLAKLA